MEKPRPPLRSWLPQLIRKAQGAGVTEFEVNSPEGPLKHLRIKLGPADPNAVSNTPLEEEIAEQSSTYEDETRYSQIRALLKGVFYRSPIPKDPPFVEEGDFVQADTRVGTLEAMKVYNEVNSPVAGRVEKIIAQNNELVEADALLMIIDKTQTRSIDAPRF